ncbi:MAG: Amuc_1100 family pilus-like protein [Verrucomicrobiota bacterium]
MSKAKQNTFLTGYFAALAVGAIGLGYLAFSAASGASDAAEKYAQTRAQLDKLQKSKIFPKQENVDAKKKQVTGFTEEVAKLNTDLRQYQQPLEAMEVSAFQAKLQKLRDGLQTEAKNAGVKLPEGFDLGMGNYLSSFPETEAVPKLNVWLDSLNFVVSTLISKGVKEINFLQRPELPFEKKGAAADAEKAKAAAAAAAAKKPAAAPKAGAAKAAPKEEPVVLAETDVLERYPIRITFTGSNRAVNDSLTALTNTAPGTFFFDYRVMRAENEQKVGADTSTKIEAREETDPGSGKPFRNDSIYIFGVEKVTVYLGLDLIRFVEPQAPVAKK